MHIIDNNTVLHDNSNKYQHTGEVVISYKDIKLSLWINTETQYDNIKFARLIYYHNAVASSKQKTLFVFNVEQYLNCTFSFLASYPYFLCLF